jgi:hypothetical protein
MLKCWRLGFRDTSRTANEQVIWTTYTRVEICICDLFCEKLWNNRWLLIDLYLQKTMIWMVIFLCDTCSRRFACVSVVLHHCTCATPLYLCYTTVPVLHHCTCATPLYMCYTTVPVLHHCTCATPLYLCYTTVPVLHHCTCATPL